MTQWITSERYDLPVSRVRIVSHTHVMSRICDLCNTRQLPEPSFSEVCKVPSGSSRPLSGVAPSNMPPKVCRTAFVLRITLSLFCIYCLRSVNVRRPTRPARVRRRDRKRNLLEQVRFRLVRVMYNARLTACTARGKNSAADITEKAGVSCVVPSASTYNVAYSK